MNDANQRTDQWFLDRAGRFTGSKYLDVLARAKNDPTKKLKAWHDCVWQVVVERLTGQPSDEIDAFALKWGREVEPYAREAYELETGLVVTEVGFIKHPIYDFTGCSPDGLIGTDGGMELKCPKNPAIHLQRFLTGMEDDHAPQVQGALWVTGRKWWDFVSYDPRMPENYRLFRHRYERDEEMIKRIESAVLEAEAEARRLLKNFTEERAAA